MRNHISIISYKLAGMLAAAGIMLGGCADDREPASASRPDGTYITLHLKQESAAARTMIPSEPDNTDESLITNATILFFDRNHNIVSDVSVYDIEWEFDQNGAYGATKPIKLRDDMPYGSYWVYVAANAVGSIEPEKSANLDGFAGTYDVSANPENLYAAGNFLMANKQDEITAAGKANGGIMLTIEPHQTKGTYEDPIMLTVTLERLAAKITLENTPFEPSITGAKLNGREVVTIEGIEIEGYALANCANRINLIQQWKPGGGFTTSEARDMILVSPGSGISYPLESGYFNRMHDIVPDDFSAIATPLYCLENNSPYYAEELGITDNNALPRTKMKGRTTAVVFRAQVRLSSAGDNTFYRYKNTLYSDLSAIRSEYPDVTAGSGQISDLRAAGIEVFENGVVYYTHWLKDANYTDEGRNYYAVMRNTWYKLGVSDILDIGEDTPGGITYNNTDPIDEQAGIIVTFRVNAWNIIPESEHTLGEGDICRQAE